MKMTMLGGAAAIAMVAALAPAAGAQERPAAEEASPAAIATTTSGRDDASDDIVVTGSLIRRLPREYVASPVFTYGKADVTQSGAGPVSEYILTIPPEFHWRS